MVLNMGKEPNNRKNALNKKQRLVSMRRMEAAHLYLQGHHQQHIADTLNCSVATICSDLKSLHHEWRESAAADINHKIALEIAKLDNVEATAWAAFEGSKETTTVQTEKGMTVYNTAGDPRFLVIIQSCIDKRCKILGIDAPERVELSGRGGGPIEYKERAELAVSSLASLIESESICLLDKKD